MVGGGEIAVSKLVKCDHCGRTEEDTAVIDWLALDCYDSCHLWFWPVAGPAHFCSWECLTAWANTHRPTPAHNCRSDARA